MSDSEKHNTLPLGKYLASTDKKTRDKAIKNLASFLSDSSQGSLPESELIKLWKGIFYCFWMSDKPLVQQALASELAELLLTITNLSSFLIFLRTFWQTLVREWNGIDRLRMDKYYMLIRRFVNASFRRLIISRWEKNTLTEYNSILTAIGGPLCPTDNRVPQGLTYHLADIYLEELEKALAHQPSSSLTPVPLSIILAPFFELAARTSTTVTYKRVQSSVLDPLLSALSSSTYPEGEPPGQESMRLANDMEIYPTLLSNACLEEPENEGLISKGLLKRKLLRTIFEVASQADTKDTNRRKLYTLWKGASDSDDENM